MKFGLHMVWLSLALLSWQAGWAAEKISPDPVQQNSTPRQLALLAPLPVKTQGLKNKPGKLSSSDKTYHLSLAEHQLDIRLKVPQDVDESLDACIVASRQVGSLISHRLNQLVSWLEALFKQLNSLPKATPAGSPYVPTSLSAPSQRAFYLTPEGRIKMVVDR